MLGQVPITLHGTHSVSLKACDREKVTVAVHTARSYSLPTCWGDSGKRMPGSREGQFFWQRPPLGIWDTFKWLSCLWVPRHTVYSHLASSCTIGLGKTLFQVVGVPTAESWQWSVETLLCAGASSSPHHAQAARVWGYLQRCLLQA